MVGGAACRLCLFCVKRGLRLESPAPDWPRADAHMAETVQQIRSALEQYPEPYLRQTLQEAGALRDVRLKGREIVAEVELGFPVGGYEAQFPAALAAHLADSGLKGPELPGQLRGGIVTHRAPRARRPIAGV